MAYIVIVPPDPSRNSGERLQYNEHVRDALEYSRHVTKRWRAYEALGRTVGNLQNLQNALRENPRAEVVFLLVARASWHIRSRVLGFCFCRRTWCHHIILDFAAGHPNAIRLAGGEVEGVGYGMLYSLVRLAEVLRAPAVWGEATENSAPFYTKALGKKAISDHFFIRGRTFDYCLERFKLLVLEDLEDLVEAR